MLIKRVHDIPMKFEMELLSNQIIKNVSFHRCIMDEFDFSYSIIDNVDFRSTELNGIRMYNTVIDKTKLILVNGINSNFEKCIFRNSIVLHSNFKDSIFINADLSGAIIKNTDFANCDFRGANLCVNGFESCNIHNAVFDVNTKWKSDLNPREMGAIMI